jgi:hypothetical protein
MRDAFLHETEPPVVVTDAPVVATDAPVVATDAFLHATEPPSDRAKGLASPADAEE